MECELYICEGESAVSDLFSPIEPDKATKEWLKHAQEYEETHKGTKYTHEDVRLAFIDKIVNKRLKWKVLTRCI